MCGAANKAFAAGKVAAEKARHVRLTKDLAAAQATAAAAVLEEQEAATLAFAQGRRDMANSAFAAGCKAFNSGLMAATRAAVCGK